MNYRPEQRRILEELERRKVAKDNPCHSCDGTGANSEEKVCSDCLGQGVLLTREEYQTILEVSGLTDPFDDSILDQQEFQYTSFDLSNEV